VTEEIIHVVFKTHLDIGFTDHAAKVRAQYHDRFIPQALDTGEHFFREDSATPKFIWTTGAWLIWDHLNTQPPEKVKRLEQAISRGLIRWHALPFTTHSELMSPALFRAGLSFAEELDDRFDVRTTAAKMTDVPGHTIGIVPLLAAAGVKFLHLGVNSASPVPDVPDVFRWRAPDGSEVVVMYQKSYGATHFPEGFSAGLSFAHTNDNMGPQSVPQTAEAYRDIAHERPEARLMASTLDAYGELLWARRDEFPVVDIELGDSWIHGSASDPTKTAKFLALQRVFDGWASALTPQRLAFGRGLTMVAEHTCGVDIKSYLRDETGWDRPAFERLRRADYRFAYTEASWAEQRGYLHEAVAKLEGDDRGLAEVAIADLEGEPQTELGGWEVVTDPETGDVMSVRSPKGHAVQGLDGSLMGYRYETYDVADVTAHLDTYLTQRPEWALLDHAKPGLEKATTARSAVFVPRVTGDELRLADEACGRFGGPASIRYVFRALDDERLEISVCMRGKPANRMPEASFFTFTPKGYEAWDYCKMDLWQPGNRVASAGGGQLQAVTAVRSGLVHLQPLDTPLVGPAASPFMPFNRQPPDLSGGLRFNIHNNKWGTNFPMWWEGDLVARYVLSIG
jgi:hypothetical protein